MFDLPLPGLRRPLGVLALLSTPLVAAVPAQQLEIRNGFTMTNGANDSYVAGGGYAYAGDSGGLSVFESATGLRKARMYFPGQITDLELVGSTLYVAARNIGLRLVDVTTPTAPVETGGYVPEDGDVRGVAIAGAHAYLKVQTDANGIQIRTIRLSDMSLTGIFSPSATDHDVYLLGRLEATSTSVIYTAIDNSGTPVAPSDFGILDTRTSPQNPSYVGKVTPSGLTRGLHADASSPLAYVATASSFNGLQIFDLTDPTAPVDNGSSSLPSGFTPGVVVADASYAYVGASGPSANSGSIAAYSVSGGVPAFVSGSETPLGYRATSLGLDGNRLLVSGNNNSGNPETELYDVSTPATPTSLGSHNIPNHNEGVYVVGDYAYLASGYDGLWTVNVTNPDSPRLLANADCCSGGGNLAENIWVRDDGNYAYGAEGVRTVYYDTVSKTAPSVIASVDYGGWQEGVRELNDYLYVFSHDLETVASPGGITLVDISTPLTPVQLDKFVIHDTVTVTPPATPMGRPKDGYVDTDGHIYTAATSHLWVVRHNFGTDTLSGVASFDITAIAGHGSTELIDLDKRGNYVYAAARKKNGGSSSTTVGLLIFDVSTPSSPTYVTTLATQNGIQGIWIDGDYAYMSTVLSTGESGVTMLDLTSPTAPTVVDELVMSDTILNTHVSGGRLYGAGFRAGTPIADIDLTPTSLLEDDFSFDLHDWDPVGAGLWAIENEELSGLDLYGSSPHVVGEGTAGANRFQATARAVSTGSTLGFANLLFDYQSPSDTKFIALYAAADQWWMGEVVGGSLTLHQVLSDPILFDTDYDLDVDFTGTTATLRVGGVVKLTHTFGTNNGGSTGLSVLSSHCHFDDVTVN